MKKRKLKPFVVPMLYTIAIVLFVGSMYLLDKAINKSVFKDTNEESQYVNDEIIEDNNYLPVVNETEEFIKPFVIDNVNIVKDFYDYKAEIAAQEKSIIYFENTYMQNCGVDYSHTNGDKFDVVSSINGTISEIREDNLLGNTVIITNDNNVKLVYQSLSDLKVNKGDNISIGQVIGQSGTSTINSDLGNHLHFELYVNDEALNPENYYNLPINKLLEG